MTAVFAAVLTMALVSVGFVARVKPARQAPYYLGLYACLALVYLVRPQDLLAAGPWLARSVGALMVAAPVFFSGVVFTVSLARAADTARALGSNLIGAVVGGFLEYASLAWGIRSLTLLAIAVYLLSSLALKVEREPGTGPA